MEFKTLWSQFLFINSTRKPMEGKKIGHGKEASKRKIKYKMGQIRPGIAEWNLQRKLLVFRKMFLYISPLKLKVCPSISSVEKWSSEILVILLWFSESYRKDGREMLCICLYLLELLRQKITKLLRCRLRLGRNRWYSSLKHGHPQGEFWS